MFPKLIVLLLIACAQACNNIHDCRACISQDCIFVAITRTQFKCISWHDVDDSVKKIYRTKSRCASLEEASEPQKPSSISTTMVEDIATTQPSTSNQTVISSTHASARPTANVLGSVLVEHNKPTTPNPSIHQTTSLFLLEDSHRKALKVSTTLNTSPVSIETKSDFFLDNTNMSSTTQSSISNKIKPDSLHIVTVQSTTATSKTSFQVMNQSKYAEDNNQGEKTEIQESFPTTAHDLASHQILSATISSSQSPISNANHPSSFHNATAESTTTIPKQSSAAVKESKDNEDDNLADKSEMNSSFSISANVSASHRMLSGNGKDEDSTKIKNAKMHKEQIPLSERALRRKIKREACRMATLLLVYKDWDNLGQGWPYYAIKNPMLNRVTECKKLLKKRNKQ